jgi:hypothetical protein
MNTLRQNWQLMYSQYYANLVPDLKENQELLFAVPII